MKEEEYDDTTALISDKGNVQSSASLAPMDAAAKRKQRLLYISFLLLVGVGLGNKVFQKLQTLPMYNYPFPLSLYTTFVYIPLSFSYILPVQKWGTAITKEQRAVPRYKFAIMGALDSLAGLMQVFGVNYITSGSLIVLLFQAAIPISMIISKIFLKAKYKLYNYIGAALVLVGLVVVLVPRITKGSNASSSADTHPLPTGEFLTWVAVLVLSCVPMTLSSVYKEKALGDVELDIVYMNGWVAIFQFLFSIPLAIPSALAIGLPIKDLPRNIADGFRCYVGIDSVDVKTGKLQPDHCGKGPFYVNVYILFNIMYNILIIAILKYGNANLLWLAMTVLVPLVNVAFALHFVPSHQPLKPTDIGGLVIIMGGLIVYRFWGSFWKLIKKKKGLNLTEKTHAVSAFFGGFEPLVVPSKKKIKRAATEIRGRYYERLGIGAHGRGPIPIARDEPRFQESHEMATSV